MSEDQEKHLLNIIKSFNYRVTHKYRKGAEEHGGNLWQKDVGWMIDQAIDEAIDQYVYLVTLKEQLKDYRPTDFDRDGNL